MSIFSFVCIFFVSPLPVQAACVSDDFAGGAGTELDPWQIETVGQLVNVGTCLGSTHADKYFILNNDIDLDVAPYNTGSGWSRIGTGTTTNGFYGKFNGNYHTISNLFIDLPTSNYVGLFGYTEDGSVVENVVLENVNVTGGGFAGVGSVVGYLEGSLRNAGVDGGTVSGLMRAGGLVGMSEGGVIDRVFSRNVTVTQRTASNQCCIGGLLGGNEFNGIFRDGYSRSDVVHTSGGQGGFGGLIGNAHSSGLITRGYATGTFTTLATRPNGVGALQGYIQVAATDSYWDTETTTGFGSSPSGTGLATAEMQDQANYAVSWDFDTVWAIDPNTNDGYPYFQWEENRALNTPDETAPAVDTLSPADNAMNISASANLVITFDEAVDVETGNVVIYNASDDLVFETIDVTSGQVTGTGTTIITIDPVNVFTPNTSYYVQIDATAFDDVAGNSFVGISDTTTWNFTTADVSETVKITTSPASVVMDENAATQVVEFSLSEPIIIPDGGENGLTIYVSSSNTSEFTVTPASVSWENAEWAETRTVTLTSVNDDDTGNDTANLIWVVETDAEFYAGISSSTPVTLTDDDVEEVVEVSSGSSSGGQISDPVALRYIQELFRRNRAGEDIRGFSREQWELEQQDVSINKPNNTSEPVVVPISTIDQVSVNNTHAQTNKPPLFPNIWLMRGDRGQNVRSLQMILSGYGYTVTVDGIFGSQTERAVRSFQESNNLTVDGIVGPKTREMLIR